MNGFNAIGDFLEELKKKYGVRSNVTTEELQKKRCEWFNDSEGNLHETDGYNCSECKNKGFIAYVSDTGHEVQRVCKCQKIRATLRRAQRSGLGNILKDFTFDKYEASEEWQKQIKDKAQAFCGDDSAKWFYVGGQVGSGKSHICTAICGHYIKAGFEVLYMLWAEESKKLKALVNDVSYQEMLDKYKNVPVLYIDDFLKVKAGETPTAADINLAFEIINHRLLDPEKITVISSEKMLDEVMEYDEATMSRVYQKSGRYKISIGRDRGRNYRLKEGDVI